MAMHGRPPCSETRQQTQYANGERAIGRSIAVTQVGVIGGAPILVAGGIEETAATILAG
jgi:hypothetical protein